MSRGGWQLTGVVVLFVCIILAIAFGGEYLSLWWQGHFGVKHQTVERKVFEQTKSYTHGKIQDLAKLYGEYQDPDRTDEETIAIKTLIKTQFSDFDANSINNDELRTFLTRTRGY